jgi:hypothetical protein
MPEQSIERIANDIHGEHTDGEPTSPLSIFGEADRSQAASGADHCHQRYGCASYFLKLYPRFRFQPPNWFQESSGKCQREHRHETDQSARGEEDYEQRRSY